MLWRHLRWVSRRGPWHWHRSGRHVRLPVALWTVGLLTIWLRWGHRLTILSVLRSVCLLLHVLLLRCLHVLASGRGKADRCFTCYVWSSLYLYDALETVLYSASVMGGFARWHSNAEGEASFSIPKI